MDRIIDAVKGKQVAALLTAAEVDVALRDHQVTKTTVGELLKMTGNEAQQVISLLKDQVNTFMDDSLNHPNSFIK